MEVEEKDLMRTILEDVEVLKGKVEGMEGMLETLIEIYTDAFYEVREEYLEKLEKIREEGDFDPFTDIKDLKRSIEGD